MANIKFEIDGKVYDFAPESFVIDNEGNIILKSKVEKKNPFERVIEGEDFYFIGGNGEVMTFKEISSCFTENIIIALIIVLMQNFFDGALSMKSSNGVCGVFLWRMAEVEITILFWIEHLANGLFLILLLKDSDPLSRLLKLARVQLRK